MTEEVYILESLRTPLGSFGGESADEEVPQLVDTCLAIMNVLYEGFNDTKYRPCPLLARMVEAGFLGKKTGQGFFMYSELSG